MDVTRPREITAFHDAAHAVVSLVHPTTATSWREAHNNWIRTGTLAIPGGGERAIAKVVPCYEWPLGDCLEEFLQRSAACWIATRRCAPTTRTATMRIGDRRPAMRRTRRVDPRLAHRAQNLMLDLVQGVGTSADLPGGLFPHG